MIKTIIFDLGGVIVSQEVERLDDTMADYLDVNPEELKGVTAGYKHDLSKGKIGLSDVYSHVLERFHKTNAVDEVVGKHLEIFGNILHELNEEILDLVKRLRERSYTVVCLVNAERDVVPLVRKRGLYDHFEKAYISPDMGMAKPDAEIFLAALEDLGCRPEDALFIDDKLENVEGARKLGMKAIHYHEGMDLEKEMAAYGVSAD